MTAQSTILQTEMVIKGSVLIVSQLLKKRQKENDKQKGQIKVNVRIQTNSWCSLIYEIKIIQSLSKLMLLKGDASQIILSRFWTNPSYLKSNFYTRINTLQNLLNEILCSCQHLMLKFILKAITQKNFWPHYKPVQKLCRFFLWSHCYLQ